MVKELRAPDYSFTFGELRFMPGLTKDKEPDLRTFLDKDRKFNLNIPLMSAAMQAVTGPDLAIALAKAGGIGVIYCSQPPENEADMVRDVKSHRAAFITNPVTISSDSVINDLISLHERWNSKHYPVVDDGRFKGFATYSRNMELLSDAEKMKPIIVEDYGMIEGPLSNVSQEDVVEFFRNNLKIKCVPIVYDGKLEALSFSRDMVEERNNPYQLLDERRRLKVIGAINTRDYEKRAELLINEGVDGLLIDSSDGYSEYQAKTIKFVKKNWDIILICGNVVNKEGYEYLARAGADSIKVGIGGGSICITQQVKGMGRGQAKAVYETSRMIREYGVPVISDGAITSDADIVKALALGSNAVMMGRYFAGFAESPTSVVEVNGRKVKPYWGEGSNKARNWQRYGHKLDVEEGVEGYVFYAGSLKEGVGRTINLMKEIMKNIGAYSIQEIHENTVMEYVSDGSRKEGEVHDLLKYG